MAKEYQISHTYDAHNGYDRPRKHDQVHPNRGLMPIAR